MATTPGKEESKRMSTEDDSLVFRTKTQVVYERLRRWVVLGTLQPGEQLDQETLAASLQVSRMPLRQALLRLEADGLIETRPHRSAVVTPLSAADIEDIYAARSVLEGLLAEEGARRFDLELLDRLEKANAELAEVVAQGDSEAFVLLDREFHMDLYERSGYPRTCETLERLRRSAERYVHYYASHAPGTKESLAEHARIIEACRERKPRLVRELTEQHLGRSARALIALAQSDARTEAEAP
jgi:DNA-binding GntR family transcriptional regulator